MDKERLFSDKYPPFEVEFHDIEGDDPRAIVRYRYDMPGYGNNFTAAGVFEASLNSPKSDVMLNLVAELYPDVLFKVKDQLLSFGQENDLSYQQLMLINKAVSLIHDAFHPGNDLNH